MKYTWLKSLNRLVYQTGILLISLILVAAACDRAEEATPEEPQQEWENDLNSQMEDVIEQLRDLNPQPIPELSPEEARQQPTPADAVMALIEERGEDTSPQPVGNFEERTIPGPEGDIPVWVYTPEGDGPFPVLVYFHGGGWVIAGPEVYDASARALTNAADAVVVSVAYRQAPENPFPAAADDAFAAYQWVTENTAELNGDSSRVAVAGESAGGNLAAVTSLRARDEGVAMPVHQLLVYPVTNHDFDTESYMEYAEAMPLSRDLMMWFWDHYLQDESQADNPYASPMQADDLSGLPPTTVITAQIDPLRSEGEAYADQLREAGNEDVEYQNYEGVTHEFFGMGAVVDEATQAVDFAASRLFEEEPLAQEQQNE